MRPWSNRIWFHKPEWYWPTWKPVCFGDDEYHYKTIVIGYNITGQIVIAYRPFRRDECAPDECWDIHCKYYFDGYPGWPATSYDLRDDFHD